jgi:hypothetical protein
VFFSGSKTQKRAVRCAALPNQYLFARKSLLMWSVIKRDLTEFVTTVKSEAKEAVISAVKKEDNEKSASQAEGKKRIPFTAHIVREVSPPAQIDTCPYCICYLASSFFDFFLNLIVVFFFINMR